MTGCTYLCPGPDADSIPVVPVRKEELAPLLQTTPAIAAWADALGFSGEPGTCCPVPGEDGALQQVLLGTGDQPVWDWAALPGKLHGCFRVAAPLPPETATMAATGWALATYRFDRYRSTRGDGFATLLWPDGADQDAVRRVADATYLVRDLINTPASDLGPAELAAAIAGVAARFNAQCSVIEGEELLLRNYPAVHAVGRASARAPRLVDLTWGDPDRPKVTLVGKGVCFDTGGLDLKPANAMKLMKKDMGGAAIMLGLAQMVMAAELPVRLRLLVPAVENSVSGTAFRPLDVIRTRKGPTVEIGNTDAEGRLILADALAEASSEQPALLLDCATLTGAARIALGTEIPALFTDDDALAEELAAHSRSCADPLWRLPLWHGYRRHLASRTADLTNAPDTPFAGAILAALFLAQFVEPRPGWAHLDVMAWNTDSRPGRPEGGEAMGMRALYQLIAARFPR